MADARFHDREPEMKGWLHKWTNYLKGYQKRWFVLSNGLLSYYRNHMEMQHTCRGTISVVSAVIHTEDSCSFVVSNGGTQTFHLRASSEIERQKWVTALELAKSKAVRPGDSDDEQFASQDINSDQQELQSMFKSLVTKLEDLRTCHDLIVKHGAALQRSLTELEQIDTAGEAATKSKSINERATLFRITSNAMINSCSEYLNISQSHGRKWQKVLENEHESRLRLEEMVEQLAKQHSNLEARALKQANAMSSPKSTSPNTDDEEFYDAEELNTEFYVSFPGKAQRIVSKPPILLSRAQGDSGSRSEDRDDLSSSGSETSGFCAGDSAAMDIGIMASHRRLANPSTIKEPENNDQDAVKVMVSSKRAPDEPPESEPSAVENKGGNSKLLRTRRSRIASRPGHSINLWSVMKNAIGKELTKIPMPVNFNEPLSMLQRVTEDFEYAELLHKAAKISDSYEQLAYVAAFCVSHYATTSDRTGKPFNPLLGETYECDRTEDRGWRSISEQVSHHPPMLAMHVEGRGWKSWSEFAISSKFRGKYLQVTPIDISHLDFAETGNHYTWRKVTTTVHNIVVGKLWIDNCGEMTITNHSTGDKCQLSFIPYSYFSRESPRKVTGVVVDKEGVAKWVLNGAWDNKIEASKVIKSSSSKGKPVLETATPKLLWKRVVAAPEFEQMYNLTEFSVQLNEPEDGVAPTDSRLRPDQRQMEMGNWDDANRLKNVLEENQRNRRRKRTLVDSDSTNEETSSVDLHRPAWFRRDLDPVTGEAMFAFTDEYWTCKEKQDWARCPDIFALMADNDD
ncbi:Oxysterol-binding protein 1 [Halotydeus destructor]|nr:Oxysterol-binding protein 1 [Halotydeus destructor]